MSPEYLNPLDELKSLDAQVEQASDLAGLKPIFFRLEEIAKAHADDFEVQLVAGDVKQHLIHRGNKLKSQAPEPQSRPLSQTSPPMQAPPPMPAAVSQRIDLTPPQPLMSSAQFGPPATSNRPGELPSTAPGSAVSPPAPMPPADARPIAPSETQPVPRRINIPRPGSAAPPVSNPLPPNAAPPELPLSGPPPLDSPEIPTAVVPSPGPLPAAAPPQFGPLAEPPLPPKPPLAAALPQAGPPFPPPTPSSVPGMGAAAGGAGFAPPMPPGMAQPPLQKPPMQPPPPQTGGGSAWRRPLWIGAILGIVIALAGTALLVMRKRDAGNAQPVAVQITTAPSGAAIRINGENRCTSGDCNLNLAPGTYQVTASLDGYDPAASSLTVTAGQPANLNLTLEPAAQTVRVLTDLEQGKVTLDSQPPVDLQEGQFVFDQVQPGQHTLKITSRSGEAALQFELAVAKLPAITAPFTTRNLLGVAILSFANQARVLSSSGPMKLAMNGQPQPDVTPQGVDLQNFQPGVSELVLGEGQHNMKESFGPAPAVTLFLKSDQNIGTLIVSTVENDVKVFLNDREYPRRTQRGAIRIPAIGKVTVRVAKDGFDSPPAQVAEVKKGAEVRLEFKMARAAEFGTLSISGGTPGANVLIDQRQVGAIAADGTFDHASVLPGQHNIEIRRDGFTTKRMDRTFRAGETVTLSGSDVQLASNAPPPPPPPVEVKKPEPPPPPKPQPPPPPRIGTMADFEQPEAWRQEDGVWVHRGAAFLTFKTPPRGTFEFTVHLRRGGNLFRGGRARWFVNLTDAKNYALYEIDNNNFWGKVVENGKTLERNRVQHKDDNNDKEWTVQIEVAPERIVHRILSNGQWVPLDVWAEQGRNFTQGKFGFLVQGNDEIGVSNFKFTPAR